jgi:hypothetical protein
VRGWLAGWLAGWCGGCCKRRLLGGAAPVSRHQNRGTLCRPAPPALPAAPQGFISGANHSGKRTQVVLFINGRPVECGPLRRALEGAYAAVLPKGYRPFVLLVRGGPWGRWGRWGRWGC